jgi:hypothetical protein
MTGVSNVGNNEATFNSNSQLTMMATMDFSNGLGSGLGGSTSTPSHSNSDIDTDSGSSNYLIDDALENLDPSAISWGIPDEDEWSQNVLKTPQGSGDIPYEKSIENDTEPGIPEEEQRGLERMRGLGMPDRYGIVVGGTFDENVQRTLPRGILVNKMLMRVGGLPLRVLEPGTDEAIEIMKFGGSIILNNTYSNTTNDGTSDGALVEDSKTSIKKEETVESNLLGIVTSKSSNEENVGKNSTISMVDDDAPPGSELATTVGVPPVLNAIPLVVPTMHLVDEDLTSSSSSSSLNNATQNNDGLDSTAPIRVKVRRQIRWIDHDENAGPALASKNHFAPCSTYVMNSLVAVRYFDGATHIVEDPKKAQRAANAAALMSSSGTTTLAEAIEDTNTGAADLSNATSSEKRDETSAGGAVSFEEARKREKSREKSLLATVAVSSSSQKKKVPEHLHVSPSTAVLTIIPACAAKVAKGWLSPLGPPKLKTTRTPFASPEAAKLEKEMQSSAALKAQLMGQRYLGGRGGAAPLLHPFAWKDKNKIDPNPELVPDGLASSMSRGTGTEPAVQKVFEHIHIRWHAQGLGGAGSGFMNPQLVQQKFQQQAQQQALQLAQQQLQLQQQLQQQQLQQQLQQQMAQAVAAASQNATSMVTSSTPIVNTVDSTSSSLQTTSTSAPGLVFMNSATSSLSSAAATAAAAAAVAASMTRPLPTVATLPQQLLSIVSATPTTTNTTGKKPCMFFQSKTGCRNGAKCPYLHDPHYKAPQEDFNRISAAEKKNLAHLNLSTEAQQTGAIIPQMQMQQQQQQQQQQIHQGWGIPMMAPQQPQWMQQHQMQPQQQQVMAGWGQPMMAPQQNVGWGIPQQMPQQMQPQPQQVMAGWGQPMMAPQTMMAPQQPVGWGIHQMQPQQQQMQSQQQQMQPQQPQW